MTAALAFLYGGAALVIATTVGILRGLKWLGELDNDLGDL